MESTLLPDSTAQRLVETCRDRAGDRLRSVTFFTRDDFDQLYLREDLERGADLSSFIGLEWRESGITQDAYHGTELGEHRYTIRAFKNGYLVRVSIGNEGAFVTTDGLTLDGFEDLAAAMIEHLEAIVGD